MPSADPWDEAWDAYEARCQDAPSGQAALGQAASAGVAALDTPPAPPAARRGVGRRRAWLLAGLLALLLGAALPGLQLGGLLLRHDAAGLLATLPAGGATLRLDPVPGTARDAAGSYLGGLAAELASGARDPAAVGRLLEARRLAAPPLLRDPAAAQPERVRLAWPLGWSAARLELLPREGSGGLVLDLSWQQGSWRIHQVALRGGAG